MSDILSVLEHLISSDNGIRNQAEADYEICRANMKEDLMFHLLSIASLPSTSIHVTSLCHVILRRDLTTNNSAFSNMDNEK